MKIATSLGKRAKHCRILEIGLEVRTERLCLMLKVLQNEYFVSKFRFDLADNELSEVEMLTSLAI